MMVKPNDDKLMLSWSFDEGKGKAAVERVSSKANRIHYVFNQAQFTTPRDPQWRRGVLGSALLFDGYSTYISHQANDGVSQESYVSELSIGAWIAPRTYDWGAEGKLAAIINQHHSANKQGFLLGMFRHGRWSFQFGLESGQWVEIWAPAGEELPKQTWSYIHAVFDGEQGEATLYLNGRPIASRILPKGSQLALANDTELLIGKNNECGDIEGVFSLHMFNGLLDELKVHAYAWSAEEVLTSYQEVTVLHNGHPQLNVDDIKLDRTPLFMDRHRPQYHVSPPAHWMNEPHAPIYFEGKYHLFYQHNPLGPYFHHIHWGHWVSDDLVHWKDLPIALAPENDGLAPDGMWSGSASYDKDGLPVLFFTAGNDSASPNQSVALARSTYPEDGDKELIHWKKHPQPLIVQQQGIGAFGDFRDPFVWKDNDRWYALVGSGIEGEGGAALGYVSEDMLNWSYKGPFFKADIEKFPYLGPIWELPVFLPLGKDAQGAEKHLLLVSPVGAGADVEVFYWIGQLDEHSFSFIPEQEEPQLIDVGDFHFTGPSGMLDPKTGRNIVFTIAQGDRTLKLEYEAGWAHNAGLPICVYLREDGRLGIEPIEELQSLRKQNLLSVTEQGIADVNEALQAIQGDMLEIQLELEATTAVQYGIKVRRSPRGEEETLLYYDSSQEKLLVDRTKTTLSEEEKCKGIQGGSLQLNGEHLKLHIYLDRSMVEAYANGLKSLTTRVYPTREDALGLQIWGDGQLMVKSLDIWELSSIW